jgi:hypothetical protein
VGAAGRALAFVAALAGAFLIAALALRPPVGGEGGPDAISTSALMRDIRVIAKAPHVTGSPAQAEVRRYLASRLTQMGLAVELRPFPLPADGQRRLARWNAPASEGVNIVGSLPGSDPSLDPIVLMAHYDSVPASPGAADDAAGVASILEITRIMIGENRRELIVLFTDAEEPALGGSRAFFAGSDRIGAVVNLEARGGGGRAALFETGKGQAELTARFAAAARRPTAHSFAMGVYRFLPNYTDFTPAKDRGLPGFNFAFLGRPGLYHSPLATPDRIEIDAVHHLASQALTTVRVLDKAPTLEARGDYPVFSDVFGLFLISHAAVFGWLPIAVAALALALTASFAVRREDWRWKGLAAGVAAGLLLVPVSAAALLGMNIVSGAGADASYYDRLAQTGWLELQAVLLCLAVLLILPRRLMGLWGGWVGLMGLALVLAVVLQLIAPQAAPLIAWPTLAITLAALPLVVSNATLWRVPSFVVLTAAAAFVLYWAHLLFIAAGQDFPSAMAPFLFMAAVALWPLLQGVPGQRRVALAALGLLLAATGVAMKIWLDPISPLAATYG